MFALSLMALCLAGSPVFEAGQVFSCSPDDQVGCRGVFPVQRAEAALLTSGEDAFAARIASLRAAKKSIRVQALIFRGDEAGLMVADLLKQQKKKGLDVRVIVDAASNLDWQTQWMYFDLKQHGVEVEGYEALYLQWVAADVKAADPLRANKRFHDKLWVVDAGEPSALAIVGGRNIANEYFRISTAPLGRWRDQDIALRGALVADVAAAFDRNYEYCKGLKAKLPKEFNPDNSWKLSAATAGRVAKVRVPVWPKGELKGLAEAMAARPLELAFAPLTARFIQNRPRFKETFIPQAYLKMIDTATERVLLANAYFVPSRELSAALVRAVRRGVKVVVLTNSPETNDIAQIAAVSRYLYQGLLAVNDEAREGGAKGSLEIREWRGAVDQEGTLHAKYAVLDGAEVIIGSYNLDPRSERLNSETVLAVHDEALAAQLGRTFLEQDLPKSASVTREQAREFHKPKDVEAKFQTLYSLALRDWL
jgi:putative cardiolipin synthase